MGDPEALQELMDAYWAPLTRYARGIVGDEQDGEDLVQEAFVRLWRGRADPSRAVSPAAYLFRVVRNLSLNHQRDIRGRMRLLIERFSTRPRAPSTPAEEYAATELATAAEVAIGDLPARRREIFELHRFHGLSYREISEVMCISPQTVANQMSRALLELRDHLAPFL